MRIIGSAILICLLANNFHLPAQVPPFSLTSQDNYSIEHFGHSFRADGAKRILLQQRYIPGALEFSGAGWLSHDYPVWGQKITLSNANINGENLQLLIGSNQSLGAKYQVDINSHKIYFFSTGSYFDPGDPEDEDLDGYMDFRSGRNHNVYLVLSVPIGLKQERLGVSITSNGFDQLFGDSLAGLDQNGASVPTKRLNEQAHLLTGRVNYELELKKNYNLNFNSQLLKAGNRGWTGDAEHNIQEKSADLSLSLNHWSIFTSWNIYMSGGWIDHFSSLDNLNYSIAGPELKTGLSFTNRISKKSGIQGNLKATHLPEGKWYLDPGIAWNYTPSEKGRLSLSLRSDHWLVNPIVRNLSILSGSRTILLGHNPTAERFMEAQLSSHWHKGKFNFFLLEEVRRFSRRIIATFEPDVILISSYQNSWSHRFITGLGYTSNMLRWNLSATFRDNNYFINKKEYNILFIPAQTLSLDIWVPGWNNWTRRFQLHSQLQVAGGYKLPEDMIAQKTIFQGSIDGSIRIDALFPNYYDNRRFWRQIWLSATFSNITDQVQQSLGIAGDDFILYGPLERKSWLVGLIWVPYRN